MKRTVVMTLGALLVFGSGVANAERGGNSAQFSVRGGTVPPPGSSSPDGTPDSLLSINMAGRQSWDDWNSSNNEIFTEVLGAGAQVTGVGWDLTISTVPETDSWLWDAVISLYSSHPDTFFLDLSPGAGDGPGTQDYSTGGIVNLQDVPPPDGPIPNLPIGADGNLFIQLWEDPDDAPDAVDANYTRGSLDVAYIAGQPVPTIPGSALALLALLLAAGAVWWLSNRSVRESRPKKI